MQSNETDPVHGTAKPEGGLKSAATVTVAIGSAPETCHLSTASDPSPFVTLADQEYGRLDARCIVTVAVPPFASTADQAPLGANPLSKSAHP